MEVTEETEENAWAYFELDREAAFEEVVEGEDIVEVSGDYKTIGFNIRLLKD